MVPHPAFESFNCNPRLKDRSKPKNADRLAGSDFLDEALQLLISLFSFEGNSAPFALHQLGFRLLDCLAFAVEFRRHNLLPFTC